MNVLLADCNVTDRAAAGRFRDLMGVEADTRWALAGALPADMAGHDALVITGSKASVLDDEPWVHGLAGLVRDAVGRGRPVLGVCFGHQLIARALHGPEAIRVRPQPEVGWFEIARTAPTELLGGMSDPLWSFVSHRDEVIPQAGFEVLARSEACAVHALRVPDRPVWGVQFHLEMSRAEVEGILRYRAALHPELGIDPDAVLAAVTDTERDARRMFANFLAGVG